MFQVRMHLLGINTFGFAADKLYLPSGSGGYGGNNGVILFHFVVLILIHIGVPDISLGIRSLLAIWSNSSDMVPFSMICFPADFIAAKISFACP